jgi:hypothetical protein
VAGMAVKWSKGKNISDWCGMSGGLVKE